MTTNWIEHAINQNYIQLYPYEDFTNIKYNGDGSGEGRFGRVASAEWPISNRKVALKNLKRYDVDKFVSEVNYFLIKFEFTFCE